MELSTETYSYKLQLNNTNLSNYYTYHTYGPAMY